jgi:hypothetical protein
MSYSVISANKTREKGVLMGFNPPLKSAMGESCPLGTYVAASPAELKNIIKYLGKLLNNSEPSFIF